MRPPRDVYKADADKKRGAGKARYNTSHRSSPRPRCRCKTPPGNHWTRTSASGACTRTRPSTTSTNDSHVRPLLSLFFSSTPPTSYPPEHARYVYDVQKDSDQTDSEPEPEEEDASDGESSARRRGRSSRRIRSGKKRMSIVTSRFFDVPRLPPEFERELLEDELEDDELLEEHDVVNDVAVAMVVVNGTVTTTGMVLVIVVSGRKSEMIGGEGHLSAMQRTRCERARDRVRLA